MSPAITRGVLCRAALSLWLCACSSEREEKGADALGASSDADGGERPSTAAGLDAGSTAGAAGDAASATGSSAAGSAEGGASCAKVSNKVDLLPVHLAFAFDVSGSMGKGDKEWHDKALKWDPVVLATRTFFAAESSRGLFSSLTFFPSDGDEDERCAADAYVMPDVPMTELPSALFGNAIDAVTPKDEDDWRGGTPTAFALAGTRQLIAAQQKTAQGRYAIVLVTDGYPAGCDDDSDTIEAAVKETTAALALDIPTYVIGVKNPPIDDAPDTVQNLTKIAAAGDTQTAFVIDTGDAKKTADSFGAAINKIRASSLSCTLAIPQNTTLAFDKRKVAVRYQSAGKQSAFTYDPSCAMADAWHYDDVADPRQIVLCDQTCKTVQADKAGAVQVEFACENQILL